MNHGCSGTPMMKASAHIMKIADSAKQCTTVTMEASSGGAEGGAPSEGGNATSAATNATRTRSLQTQSQLLSVACKDDITPANPGEGNAAPTEMTCTFDMDTECKAIPASKLNSGNERITFPADGSANCLDVTNGAEKSSIYMAY